jgi:hypothetical protein
MQPAWRLPKDSAQPLLHNEEFSSNGWSDLCKGGRNGFFLVILCLAWWAAAGDATTVKGDLTGMFEDTRWVLRKMVARVQSHVVLPQLD